MATTHETGVSFRVEVKPGEPSAADRGAAILAQHIETARGWGACPQAVLAGVLADLIALSEEDPDLDFAEALRSAWQRVDAGAG